VTSIKPLGAVSKKGKKEKAKNYSLMNEAKASKRESTLWRWVSLFVRLSAVPSDETYGFAICFTCGARKHYKEMDAGHCLSRRHKNTKYHEDNLRCQCVHCNRNLYGNVAEFEKRLGLEIVNKLKALTKLPAKKMPLWEVEAKIAEYRQKAKDEAYRVGVTL